MKKISVQDAVQLREMLEDAQRYKRELKTVIGCMLRLTHNENDYFAERIVSKAISENKDVVWLVQELRDL